MPTLYSAELVDVSLMNEIWSEAIQSSISDLAEMIVKVFYLEGNIPSI
ncbi:hypothetical Protein YC6258_01347 [Gynuella sunshinyii YC6258]|uniref:Uncharacterized protein n=1 Tax=Gynuella sunshinyii YC6258 TaxID=1445510 RepID=A0A0C5V1I0_9GAMM|nr:hypothetical Protein YC6258_01347 [Gynuella sunshinyii YC6258]